MCFKFNSYNRCYGDDHWNDYTPSLRFTTNIAALEWSAIRRPISNSKHCEQCQIDMSYYS